MANVVMDKLDPSLKAKWLEALRSGEYRQTSSTLRAVDDINAPLDNTNCSYCCLGVLATACKAELEEAGYVIENVDDVDDTMFGEMTVSIKREGRPDSYYTSLADDPSLINMSSFMQSTLIEMNDSGEKSFAEIADYIEANL